MCMLNTFSTFWINLLFIIYSSAYHSMSECVLSMEKDTILVLIVGPHAVDTINTHQIHLYSNQVLILIVRNVA